MNMSSSIRRVTNKEYFPVHLELRENSEYEKMVKIVLVNKILRKKDLKNIKSRTLLFRAHSF